MKLSEIIASLNNTKVSGVGLGTVLASATVLGAQHAVDSAIGNGNGFAQQLLRGLVDSYANNIALPAICAGGFAAYAGMPKGLPQNVGVQVNLPVGSDTPSSPPN